MDEKCVKWVWDRPRENKAKSVKEIQRTVGKSVIYSQDLGYLILGLRILSPENFAGLLVLLGFEDP